MKVFTTLVASVLSTLFMVRAAPTTYELQLCEENLMNRFEFFVAYGGANLVDMRSIMKEACKSNNHCFDCQRQDACWSSCNNTLKSLFSNKSYKIYVVKGVEDNYTYYYNNYLYHAYNMCGSSFTYKKGITSTRGSC